MTPGDVLANQYELQVRLGKGGMGEVWSARDTASGERVAVKVLLDADRGDGAQQKRFLREARAAAAVKHPNVVELREVRETEDGAPFLVMELLTGETLGRRLRRKVVLSMAETAAIFLPVFDAVEAAHAAGLVHRDLKPENIYLAEEPDGKVRVRVLDFGIAKRVEKLATPTIAASADATAPAETTAAMLGTPYYMAPEQALGERDIDGRADVWSLGIVLYECLSGKRPTEAATLGGILKIIVADQIVPIGELLPTIDPDVAAALSAMLRSNREERAPSLAAIRRALAAVAPAVLRLDAGVDEGIPASLQKPAPRASRSSSSKAPWLVAALLVLGGAGLLAYNAARPAPAPAALPIAAPVASSEALLTSATPAPPPAVSAASMPAVSVAAAAARAPRTVVAIPSASAPTAPPSGPARGPSGLVTDNPFGGPAPSAAR